MPQVHSLGRAINVQMRFSDFEYRTMIPLIQGGYVRTGVLFHSYACCLLTLAFTMLTRRLTPSMSPSRGTAA